MQVSLAISDNVQWMCISGQCTKPLKITFLQCLFECQTSANNNVTNIIIILLLSRSKVLFFSFLGFCWDIKNCDYRLIIYNLIDLCVVADCLASVYNVFVCCYLWQLVGTGNSVVDDWRNMYCTGSLHASNCHRITWLMLKQCQQKKNDNFSLEPSAAERLSGVVEFDATQHIIPIEESGR